MSDSWALAATAVVSFLASLVPVFAELAKRPLAGWGRGTRVLAAIVLLMISAVTGGAAYRASKLSPSKAGTAASLAGPLATTSDPVAAPAATATATVATVSPSSRAARHDSVARAMLRPVPRLRITDLSGKSVAPLLAAAQHLKPAYHLTAELRETREEQADLQDLVTVHLTLDVSISRAGAITNAFVLQSHGGGFQQEAARVQALERLEAAFAAKLRQEVP